MAQAFKQSAEFKFRVESAPSYMQLPTGEFVQDGFFVNRRTDNNMVLGKVTDRYGIIQNTALIDAAETAFAAKGMSNFTRKVVVVGEGEKMYATYEFRDKVKKLNVGDEVGLRIILQNSFDGSLRGSLLAGILRLICTNGMVGTEKEVGLTKKHGSEIAVDFVAIALDKALAAFDKSLLAYNRLATVKITQAQGHNILNHFKAANVVSEKIRENIANIWDNPTFRQDHARNLYNLYNAATEHLTRNVEGERFELANRVSGNILTVLNRASLRPDALAKLVVPANN